MYINEHMLSLISGLFSYHDRPDNVCKNHKREIRKIHFPKLSMFILFVMQISVDNVPKIGLNNVNYGLIIFGRFFFILF